MQSSFDQCNRILSFWQSCTASNVDLYYQYGKTTFDFQKLEKEGEDFPEQESERPERFEARCEEMSFHSSLLIILEKRLKEI